MKKDILQFLTKAALLWLVPTALIAGIYLFFDPTYTLRWHREYPEDTPMYNRGMISVVQLDHHADSTNSIVFGASLGLSIPAEKLKELWGDSAKIIYYDSSYANTEIMLHMISHAIDTIDCRNAIIFYSSYLLNNRGLDHFFSQSVYAISPRLVGFPENLRLHYKVFSSWLCAPNLQGWAARKLLNQSPKANSRYPSNKNLEVYHPAENANISPEINARQKITALKHFKQYTADEGSERIMLGEDERRLSPEEIADFRLMAHLFRKEGTDLSFVIIPASYKSPFYMSQQDVDTLYSIFGESVINLQDEFRGLTFNPYNFVDEVHFRSDISAKFISRVKEIKEERKKCRSHR